MSVSNHPLEAQLRPSFKAGQIVAMFVGNYSDRNLSAVIRILVDFDGGVMEAEAKKEIGRHISVDGLREWWSTPSGSQLAGWLEKRGLAEVLEFEEWEDPDDTTYMAFRPYR
jgi:hypothetical protein